MFALRHTPVAAFTPQPLVLPVLNATISSAAATNVNALIVAATNWAALTGEQQKDWLEANSVFVMGPGGSEVVNFDPWGNALRTCPLNFSLPALIGAEHWDVPLIAIADTTVCLTAVRHDSSFIGSVPEVRQ